MGSTEIVNRTSKAMDVKVGNCRYFIKLTTVEKNQSYTVHLDYTDTYREFSLGGGAAAASKAVTVSSDECVDNKKVIVREVEGKFKVEMEPRLRPTTATTTTIISPVSNRKVCEPARKKRRPTFWRLWIL